MNLCLKGKREVPIIYLKWLLSEQELYDRREKLPANLFIVIPQSKIISWNDSLHFWCRPLKWVDLEGCSPLWIVQSFNSMDLKSLLKLTVPVILSFFHLLETILAFMGNNFALELHQCSMGSVIDYCTVNASLFLQ